ncbi:hypothetical protein [Clostridium frigoris]|nr:hypothetical protein [Clostridium frigoris]
MLLRELSPGIEYDIIKCERDINMMIIYSKIVNKYASAGKEE